MPNIGPMELIVVLVIALIVVGPKKLPGLGKQLGSGMRNFKESVSGSSHDDAPEQIAPAAVASVPSPVAQPVAVELVEPRPAA